MDEMYVIFGCNVLNLFWMIMNNPIFSKLEVKSCCMTFLTRDEIYVARGMMYHVRVTCE